jgi:hypothetical protein
MRESYAGLTRDPLLRTRWQFRVRELQKSYIRASNLLQDAGDDPGTWKATARVVSSASMRSNVKQGIEILKMREGGGRGRRDSAKVSKTNQT